MKVLEYGLDVAWKDLTPSCGHITMEIIQMHPAVFIPTVIYSMTQSAIKEDYDEMRMQAVDLLVLGGLGKVGDGWRHAKGLFNREFGMGAKEMSKISQHMRKGKFSESSLKDITDSAKDTKAYVVETPAKPSAGEAGSVAAKEPSIYTPKEFDMEMSGRVISNEATKIDGVTYINSKGMTISAPVRESMRMGDAAAWYRENLKKVGESIDTKLPMDIQIKQAAKTSKELMNAAEKALREPYLAPNFREAFVEPSIERIKAAKELAPQKSVKDIMTDLVALDKDRKPFEKDGCFAAGTLVQTKTGLVPIEKLKIGDWILSQSERKGELSYKRVVNTFVFEDKEVYLLKYEVDGKVLDMVATGNHPFWEVDQGWTALSVLKPGDDLMLKDSTRAVVICVEILVRTADKDVAWVRDIESIDTCNVTGTLVNLRDAKIVYGEEGVPSLGHRPSTGDHYFKRTVYNIEVEGFHTYYVGEHGVWVHNVDCVKGDAIDNAIAKAESQCFDGETLVHTIDGWLEIQYINPEDMVLSRCEKTGKQDYRRVLHKFTHEDTNYDIQRVDVLYRTSDGHDDGFYVTKEHPIWVNGKGWTDAELLMPGDEFEICDPEGERDGDRKGPTLRETALSGGRWTAKVVKSNPSHPTGLPVYNLEVEEFHTYFVSIFGVLVHNKDLTKPVDRTRRHPYEI